MEPPSDCVCRTPLKFGVLLPHFGEHASVDRIVATAPYIEQLGFDSVWVRDHLLWKPHELESQDTTFLDPLLTLAAVSAVTERLVLGTAVLIPVRWPLKLAQSLATLSFLSDGRVIAGIGQGSNPTEITAIGLDPADRQAFLLETIEVLGSVWGSDRAEFDGRFTSFTDVTLQPRPAAHIPILMGGIGRLAVRRAVEYADGWLPGRIPMATLDDRLGLLRSLAEEAEKEMMTGIVPLVRIAERRDEARSTIDVDNLSLGWEKRNWIPPPGGSFRSIEDLSGMLMAGDPDDCIAEVTKLAERNIAFVVFDLRLDFGQYHHQLELISRHVLPAFPS